MLINQQLGSEEVENPTQQRGFETLSLPNVTTDDLVRVMRLDESIGTDRVTSYIEHAYDVIEGYLSNFCSPQISGNDRLERIYKRAVMHEAAALFHDNNLDYDTTTPGIPRGENQSEKSDKLRRVVSHCIADLRGKRRNRVKLL